MDFYNLCKVWGKFKHKVRGREEGWVGNVKAGREASSRVKDKVTVI